MLILFIIGLLEGLNRVFRLLIREIHRHLLLLLKNVSLILLLHLKKDLLLLLLIELLLHQIGIHHLLLLLVGWNEFLCIRVQGDRWLGRVLLNIGLGVLHNVVSVD